MDRRSLENENKRSHYWIIFVSIGLSVLAWGQAVSTSQITGNVQDASGSAVAGAEIKATQTSTGAVRTTTSSADGELYVLLSLPVGPYSLEVGKAGFSTYVQTGIVLQVASNPTIPVTLAVGAVSEHVNVEANAAMVETQSTGVGQVIDSRRVLDLPLVGRQVTDLVVLSGEPWKSAQPIRTTAASTPTSRASQSCGGLGGGNIFALDGAFFNDVYALSSLPLPFPDALQEFKVETSSLPAQYGYHSGGAINAVTKSGTNEYHGGAFEFIRNYDLDAELLRHVAGRFEAQSVRRHVQQADQEKQIVLFRRISGNRYPPDPEQPDRVCAHGANARRRSEQLCVECMPDQAPHAEKPVHRLGVYQ